MKNYFNLVVVVSIDVTLVYVVFVVCLVFLASPGRELDQDTVCGVLYFSQTMLNVVEKRKKKKYGKTRRQFSIEYSSHRMRASGVIELYELWHFECWQTTDRPHETFECGVWCRYVSFDDDYTDDDDDDDTVTLYSIRIRQFTWAICVFDTIKQFTVK